MTEPEHILRFGAPNTDNYQYIAVAGDQAMLVDPLSEAAMTDQIETHGLRPVGVLQTHTHWDHLHATASLATHYDVPVYVHPAGRGDLDASIKEIREVDEGDRIPFGNDSLEVWATPGHHPSHLTYVWQDVLLVGDVLFLAGCGNPNFGGDVTELYRSVWERLRLVDGGYRLAWGHDYAAKNLNFAASVEPDNVAVGALRDEIVVHAERGLSIPWRTIAEEREVNPFFRCDSSAILRTLRSDFPGLDEDPFAVFCRLRELRNGF